MTHRKFNLNKDATPWLFPDTGEFIDRRGLLVLGKNLISVENVYSQTFDLGEAGYTKDEIAESEFNKDENKKHVFGKRSEITDFTRDSQRRLMKSCALWEPIGLQLFVTLTYPRTWPKPDERKRQFKSFMDSMRKSWPLWGGVWKLEYQKRGAPHYHLVLQTGRTSLDLSYCQQWIKEMWANITGTPLKGNRQTEVRYPKNPKRAKYYLTKEVGKAVQASKAYRAELDTVVEHSGRFWGWHNRKQLQFEGDAYTLPSSVAIMVREAVQAHIISGMKRDGVIFINDDGQAVYKNTKAIVESDMLPSFRLYDDGAFAFDDCRDFVLAKYNVDIFDHMRRHRPPR